jgi:hypothetical protein
MLFGVSHNKVVSLVKDYISLEHPPDDDEPMVAEVTDRNPSRKERILCFLKFIYESDVYSEPMVGYPANFRRITLLHSKDEVFVLDFSSS